MEQQIITRGNKATPKAKRVITIFFITAFLIIGCLYFVYATSEKQVQIGNTFFFSTECHYCASVENYMAKNNIKPDFYSLDVYNSKNQEIFLKVAKECKLPEPVGIPVLYYNKVCYSGNESIISFLESKK